MNFKVCDANGRLSQNVPNHTWLTGSASAKRLFLYLDWNYVIAALISLLHDKCIISIHAALEMLATLLKKNSGKHQKHNCFC